MPHFAPQLAVGDGLQADLLLFSDNLFDCRVFAAGELIPADFAVLPSPAAGATGFRHGRREMAAEGCQAWRPSRSNLPMT
jgi:hypothetical protein